jgi:SlyX protein
MNQTITDLVARIDELEARLAHQDQSTLELSDEVYRHQLEIADLERQLRSMADRLQAMSSAMQPQSTADERPPHY